MIKNIKDEIILIDTNEYTILNRYIINVWMNKIKYFIENEHYQHTRFGVFFYS